MQGIVALKSLKIYGLNIEILITKQINNLVVKHHLVSLCYPQWKDQLCDSTDIQHIFHRHRVHRPA